ncbi:MAG TPA: AAA family ATPase [Mycobacteriales bacterium]|nr:AAA family ATPase [Mycobacteriales bacterium]
MLGSARAGVRKTVTVLFADVRGAEGHDDLELDVRATQAFYDLLKEVLERYGGTVERHAGDAVMAVFGVPAARDDDARRAVAAALEMHAAVGSLPGEVHVAVGINTGEVLTGDASSQEELAVGDPVVVAARLQQQAAAGETLLGPATARMLQGSLRTGPPRDVVLRGRVGTLRVHPLLAISAPHGPTARGPFVGREGERRMVRAALERTTATGIVQLVTVFGEAGTGKSRLLHEVLTGLDGVRVARGTCRAYGEGSTWSAVVEVLADLAEGPGQEALVRLEEAHAQLSGVARVLSSLHGQGDTPVSAEDLANALARVLLAVAEKGPLVVVLEDLHAAAGSLLDLVPSLLRRLDQAPVAVLVTARPELLEHRQGWGRGLRHVVGLTLRPLRQEDARTLAQHLLPADPEGVELVLAAAGGSPLFLEQLAQARREGADISGPAAPPTVAAVLSARLDRLPLEARRVLDRAAIIGSSGRVEDLVPLCEGQDVDVERELAALAARDLVLLDGDSWTLASDLVREVTIATIARAERADLHQVRGLVLGARGASAPAGFHLEQAAQLLRQSDPERSATLAELAASRLAAAGLRALSGDLVAACDMLGRALALLPSTSSRRMSLQVELARGLQLTGELGRAHEVLDEAVTRSLELGLSEAHAHARLARLDLLRSTEPERAYAELPGLLAEVLPTLESASDDRGLSLAWQLQASALQYRVRWAAMQQPLEKALHHGQRSGDRRLVEQAQGLQVGSMFHGPMPLGQARLRLDELLAQPGGSPWHQATIAGRRAGALALQGETEQARELIAEVRDTFRDLGRELSVLATAFMSGPIEMLAGAPERAAKELSDAVEGLQAMGDRAFASTLAALLAEACWRCDDQAGAAAAVALSRRLSGVGDVISQVRWRCVQAKLEAVRRNSEVALELSSEAVNLVVSTDELASQGDVLADAAEVQLILGNTTAAGVLLRDALARYERKQAPQAAAVARARLGL